MLQTTSLQLAAHIRGVSSSHGGVQGRQCTLVMVQCTPFQYAISTHIWRWDFYQLVKIACLWPAVVCLKQSCVCVDVQCSQAMCAGWARGCCSSATSHTMCSFEKVHACPIFFVIIEKSNAVRSAILSGSLVKRNYLAKTMLNIIVNDKVR